MNMHIHATPSQTSIGGIATPPRVLISQMPRRWRECSSSELRPQSTRFLVHEIIYETTAPRRPPMTRPYERPPASSHDTSSKPEEVCVPSGPVQDSVSRHSHLTHLFGASRSSSLDASTTSSTEPALTPYASRYLAGLVPYPSLPTVGPVVSSGESFADFLQRTNSVSSGLDEQGRL